MTGDAPLLCHCGRAGEFGYRSNTGGELVWYCATHCVGHFYADARREVTEEEPARDQSPAEFETNESGAPDLQSLVQRYGRWDLIPPDVHLRWDAAVARWQRDRREYLGGPITGNKSQKRSPAARRAGSERQQSSADNSREGTNTMLMKKYAGDSFLKADDVRNGPRRARIVDVRIGKFDRPVLELEDGDKLTLNATNVKTLSRHFGDDSRDWHGCLIELYLGRISYNGEDTDSVLVRVPGSPAAPVPAKPAPVKPLPPIEQSLDDEIPF
jgi:hypothetical protein